MRRFFILFLKLYLSGCFLKAVVGDNMRELATKIALLNYGKPYIWGGDDPIKGFDCSGFMNEILKSVGILPLVGDWTADGLYHRFDNLEVEHPYEGCLMFLGDFTKIYHVEYCINSLLSIGASGGGRRTLTEADAINHNAYIKIRPLENRNVYKYCDPFL